jgi:hypothetical protein
VIRDDAASASLSWGLRRVGWGGLVHLRACDIGDSAADDLFTSKLSAEDECRQDHHLGHSVMALDVRGRVVLGKARDLCSTTASL